LAQQSQQRIPLAGIDIGKQGIDRRPVAAQIRTQPPTVAGIGRLRLESSTQRFLLRRVQHAPALRDTAQLNPLARSQRTPGLPVATLDPA
jgi:hypothetical protein